MRVLLVHNYYGSSAPSGENTVFELEKSLLEEHGHEVEVFTRHSDDIRKQGLVGVLRGGLSTAWNPFMARFTKRYVASFRPDVVHVHNTFPLISPSIFSAIGNTCATVLTLHNYRLFCPAGIPMRNGFICTKCIDTRTIRHSVFHGCYRGSRVATLPVATNVALHRGLRTWDRHVDAFIALSSFQKELMSAGGLPSDKIEVKPNYYPGNPSVRPLERRPERVVFVGRLSEEKGIKTIIKAWKTWGSTAPELRLIGDGPMREEVMQSIADLPITLLGPLPQDKTEEEISNARMLVLPSQWFEGFPLVLREAFAYGTPVAVSDIGPLRDIVGEGEIGSQAGVSFRSGDPDAWCEGLRSIFSSNSTLNSLSAGGRMRFETLYNDHKNYEILMSIYENAILRNKNGFVME